MKFTVQQAAMCSALRMCRLRARVPVATSVRIVAGNGLRIAATDLEVMVDLECEAVVDKAGEIMLPADKLTAFVGLLPAGPVEFSVGENQNVVIKCGRSRTRMTGLSAADFPTWDATEPAVAIPGSTALMLLNRVLLAVTTAGGRYTLEGAKISCAGGLLTAVATDGRRLSLATVPADGKCEFLLPMSAGEKLVQLLRAGDDGEVQIGTEKNSNSWVVGKTLVMSRNLAGRFPDYQRVLNLLKGDLVTLDRLEFLDALRRVGNFSDKRSGAVLLKLEGAELAVSAAGSEDGEAWETLACENPEGAIVSVVFNWKFIADFLDAVSAERVSFRLDGSDGAAELRPVGDDSYRYVVMPMRT